MSQSGLLFFTLEGWLQVCVCLFITPCSFWLPTFSAYMLPDVCACVPVRMSALLLLDRVPQTDSLAICKHEQDEEICLLPESLYLSNIQISPWIPFYCL